MCSLPVPVLMSRITSRIPDTCVYWITGFGLWSLIKVNLLFVFCLLTHPASPCCSGKWINIFCPIRVQHSAALSYNTRIVLLFHVAQKRLFLGERLSETRVWLFPRLLSSSVWPALRDLIQSIKPPSSEERNLSMEEALSARRHRHHPDELFLLRGGR